MSVLGVLTSKQVTFLDQSGAPILTFDASISEKHGRKAEATKFETENAQTISDHIVLKTFTLTLQVLSSDSQLNPLNGALATGATAILQRSNIVQNATGAIAAASLTAQAISSLTSPSNGIYQQLINIQDQKFPFDVFTTIGIYRNMWIENIDVPRDNKTGAGLIFNVDLVQLLLVNAVTVNTAIFANASLSSGQTDKGEQATGSPAASAIPGLNAALNAIGAPP